VIANINRLIRHFEVAGLPNCVNATVFDAYCHDLVPCLVTDTTISHLAEETEVMIERMRRNGYHVLSTAEYLAASLE
jgi:hypothetical protein